MDLIKYPNLRAILNDTISGKFNNWPPVIPELIKMFAEVEKLKAENNTHFSCIVQSNIVIADLRKALENIKKDLDPEHMANSDDFHAEVHFEYCYGVADDVLKGDE